jgi:hypothetical protein
LGRRDVYCRKDVCEIPLYLIVAAGALVALWLSLYFTSSFVDQVSAGKWPLGRGRAADRLMIGFDHFADLSVASLRLELQDLSNQMALLLCAKMAT